MTTGKISRTFGWGLMGLVIVGLVGFGSTNFSSSARSIGTVGDNEIDAQQYARELNAEMRAFSTQTGQTMTLAQAQAFGLEQQVLGRLLASTALENETARLGVSVGDEQLRGRIVEIAAFKGIDGKFDREAYSFSLDQSGLTAAEFEASLRSEVARQLLQTAVVNGTTASSAYVDALYGYARETRSFTWARLPVSALTAELPAATKDALKAYYDAKNPLFTLPETKDVTYIWLSPDDLIPSITVSEEDLQALYKERLAEFVIPERRMVERLVFGSEADAQAAADAIAAGEKTFEDAVFERDLALSDVDLGDLSKEELGAAADVVFALSEPGVAGPVNSDLGPSLFRMNAILAARETSFEAARTELHSELAADTARRQLNNMITELDDQLADGVTLEKLKESHHMRLVNDSWTDGSSEGIAAYDSFRDAVRAAAKGDFPEITLMSDGGIFALRVNKVEASRLQPQDEVTDQVLAGWASDKRLELLAVQAQGMIPALETGESLSSLELVETMETDQGRDAFIQGIPSAFIADVFDMSSGDWRVIPSNYDVILVHLDAVTPADQNSEDATTTKEQFAANITEELGVDVGNAFARALEAQAGVTLNRPLINAIHAQFP